jgi:NAD(P)-dependent dehydrogenase (short-subunit alcohol dehydrogenase family)
MATSVRDKVVLITGGARGIGAETARQLVDGGARVALLDRDGPGVKATAAALGERAVGFEADVTDTASLADAVAATVERFGGIDVVVANAGIAGVSAPVATADPAVFEKVLEVDLLGVWRSVRATLPHVVARKGYVLVVASVAAVIPTPTMAAYGMAKAGAESFGRSLRIELAPAGTAVGVAYFGVIATDMMHDLRASPALDQLVAGLPGPLGRPTPAAAAGAAIMRGIERRAAIVYAPRWVPVLLTLRGQLAPFERVLGRLPGMSRLIAGTQ